MASDFEKPNKVHTLYKNEIEQKMWTLPASELFMVGKKTISKLENMGVKTIGDIAKKDITVFIKKFGKHGKLIWEYANGIDNSEVIYIPEKPKCISNCITLPQDISDINKLNEILLALSEQIGYRLRKYEMSAEVIGVQIRTSDFTNFSHQIKLMSATNTTKIIYETSKKLLIDLLKNRKIRLIGIKADKLIDKNEYQLSLFNLKENTKQTKIDQILDEVKDKYGYNSITRAGEMKVKGIINIRKENQE